MVNGTRGSVPIVLSSRKGAPRGGGGKAPWEPTGIRPFPENEAPFLESPYNRSPALLGSILGHLFLETPILGSSGKP